MSYGDCEICTTDATRFSKRKSAQGVKLFGGFAIHICSDCHNEWVPFCRDSAPYKADFEFRLAEQRRAIEMHAAPRSEERAQRLKVGADESELARRENDRAAYDLAKQWVAQQRAAHLATGRGARS